MTSPSAYSPNCHEVHQHFTRAVSLQFDPKKEETDMFSDKEDP